ncbi:hypothetical protein A0H81_00677 [Grifola frondosa]|uniref:Uncharacterized protein n=1 Tax=Grifola frondosa TaxID=5627 RepID=A0A1C7MT81_GRIFR|nr:hypothetical protein A0H81_00677 [Grifola frondosa]
MINDVVEVVDVDALSSDDPDVECKGYKRNLSKNAQKNVQNVPTKPKLRPKPSTEPEFIVIDSDSDDEAPVPMASSSRTPVQFPISYRAHDPISSAQACDACEREERATPEAYQARQRSPNPALLNPMKRSFTAFKSSPASDVISIPDSSDEEEPVMKKQRQAEDYIDDISEVDHMDIQLQLEVNPVAVEEEDIGSDSDMSYAAYDLDVPSNWIDPPEPPTFLDINDDHQDEDNDDLALQMSSLSKKTGSMVVAGCHSSDKTSVLAARPTRRRRHYGNPFYHDSFPCYRRLQPVAPSFRSPGAINWIAQANGNHRYAMLLRMEWQTMTRKSLLTRYCPPWPQYAGRPARKRAYEVLQLSTTSSSILHVHNARFCGRKTIILDTVHYDCSPEALHFKPDDSLLAVSGEDGCIFLQHDSHTTKLIVAPKKSTTPLQIWCGASVLHQIPLRLFSWPRRQHGPAQGV